MQDSAVPGEASPEATANEGNAVAVGRTNRTEPAKDGYHRSITEKKKLIEKLREERLKNEQIHYVRV